LLDKKREGIRLVALAGNVPKDARVRFNLLELPLCRSALESGRPVFIEDVLRDSKEMNHAVTDAFDARCVVLLPLVIGERRMGFLALSNSEPYAFDDGERRLAELLGRTASVILSNSELYNRMAVALQDQQRLSRQREALFAANAAVYRATTLQASLQAISELAPQVLGIDICMVALDEAGGDRAFVAAVTEPHGHDLVGKSFARKGTNGEIVRATKRMLVIDQAATHPGVHPTFREQLRVASVAYMPLLRSDGAFMGTLAMIRHKSGPFGKDQLDLAELFTSRAASAIENAQLLEQASRDAQTRAMLLRELNHRVKNNLASIVTLLSLDEPELSPEAKRWLDRATDRIRTMAHAHQLFTGSPEGIFLSVLVQRTVSSLSVVRLNSVTVQTDVPNDIKLGTERAVSVAMVLHELCYNAIVHGLAGKCGTVTIRGQVHRGGNGDRSQRTAVVLEVIDVADTPEPSLAHAAHADETPIPVHRSALSLDWLKDVTSASLDERSAHYGKSGLGLMLVDGLVSRELDGAFSLHRTATGTLARVWFPVPDEK
jgi:two-component sensor histidine kinase